MENKGYISRLRGERDKRSVVLELTSAGEALLDRDPLRVVGSGGDPGVRAA